MRSYTTSISGEEIAKILSIPKEFIGKELRITLKPIPEAKKRFLKMLDNPIEIDSLLKNDRESLHAR